MNRLTERNEDIVYYAKGKYGPKTLSADMETWEVRECMRKLAAYEDIGLEPEELKQLHDENISIKKWNACEKELFEKYQTDSEKLIEVEAELAEYEDLEEQDLLIKLPCKAGDTVFIYADFTKNIEPYTVEAIHLGSCYTIQFDCSLYINDELIDSTEFELEDFRKTVFLTQEEAEKALEVAND